MDSRHTGQWNTLYNEIDNDTQDAMKRKNELLSTIEHLTLEMSVECLRHITSHFIFESYMLE